MADLDLTPSWDAVRQIEITDPVEGGPGGLDNVPLQALGNRTEIARVTFGVCQWDPVNQAVEVPVGAGEPFFLPHEASDTGIPYYSSCVPLLSGTIIGMVLRVNGLYENLPTHGPNVLVTAESWSGSGIPTAVAMARQEFPTGTPEQWDTIRRLVALLPGGGGVLDPLVVSPDHWYIARVLAPWSSGGGTSPCCWVSPPSLLVRPAGM